MTVYSDSRKRFEDMDDGELRKEMPFIRQENPEMYDYVQKILAYADVVKARIEARRQAKAYPRAIPPHEPASWEGE